MDIITWEFGTDIDAEAETEEIKLAQFLLDEARLSYAYARLASLINALASGSPGSHASASRSIG